MYVQHIHKSVSRHRSVCALAEHYPMKHACLARRRAKTHIHTSKLTCTYTLMKYAYLACRHAYTHTHTHTHTYTHTNKQANIYRHANTHTLTNKQTCSYTLMKHACLACLHAQKATNSLELLQQAARACWCTKLCLPDGTILAPAAAEATKGCRRAFLCVLNDQTMMPAAAKAPFNTCCVLSMSNEGRI